MRDRTEYYGSKQVRGVGRKLAGESSAGRMPYRAGITLDVRRPRPIRESYKQTEDSLASDFMVRNTQVVRCFKNIWGYEHAEDGTGASGYYGWSGLTGPTPDGRKDRDVFNDGTVSPYVGTDKKGPTAILSRCPR